MVGRLDGTVDTSVGDDVMALFIPVIAGPSHAAPLDVVVLRAA